VKMKDRSKEIVARFIAFRMGRGWSYGMAAIRLECSGPFICMVENRKKKPSEKILARMLLVMDEYRNR